MTSRWLSGVGLHTGMETRARYAPAATGAGLLVRRVDVGVEIAVACASVARLGASRCTCLEQDGQRVETVEHALAALVGLGIHDAILEVDGPEVPILDGSALPFVHAAREASLPRSPPRLRVATPTLHEERGGSLRLDPADAIEVTSTIDFPHPAVGRSTAGWSGDPEEFERQIAPARSFAFADEVEPLRRSGRIRGGSLDCAVVFGPAGTGTGTGAGAGAGAGVLNPGGLRFPDEPARHKLLDLIGDLALVGGAPLGHVTADRYGHALGARAFSRARLRGD